MIRNNHNNNLALYDEDGEEEKLENQNKMEEEFDYNIKINYNIQEISSKKPNQGLRVHNKLNYSLEACNNEFNNNFQKNKEYKKQGNQQQQKQQQQHQNNNNDLEQLFQNQQNQQQQFRQWQQQEKKEQQKSNMLIEEENNQTPIGQDPKQFQDLLQFFENYRKMFKMELIQFPIPSDHLRQNFQEFYENNRYIMEQFIKRKMNGELLSDKEIFQILESEIYDPILKEIVDSLQKEINQYVQKACQTINYEQEFQIEAILMKMDEKQDIMVPEFLNYLIKNPNKDYLKPPIYQSKNPDILMKAKIINDTLSQLYLVLLKYNEKIYQRFEIQDKFELGVEDYILMIQEELQKGVLKNHKNIYVHINQKMDFCYSMRKQEINNEIEVNLNLGQQGDIQNFMKFSKEYQQINLDLFMEDLKNNLGFPPCEVLIKQYRKQICDIIQNKALQEVQNINQGYQKVFQKLQPIILDLLHDFCQGQNKSNNQNKNSFFVSILDQNIDLFIILACQVTSLVRFKEEFLIFKKEIILPLSEKIKKSLIKNESQKLNIKKILEFYEAGYEMVCLKKVELQNMLKKQLSEFCKNDQNQIQNFKQSELQLENLQLIFYLYTLFTDISIDREQKQFKVNKFKTLKRHFLIKSIRNFRNGMFGFLNYQVIGCIDQIIEREIIFNFGQEHNTAHNMDILGKHGLNLKLQNNQYHFLLALRNQQFKEAEEMFQNEIHQIYLSNQDDKIFQKPEKFSLEKMSDPLKFSKKIIICISGFTSENEDMSQKWFDCIQQNPDSEVYSYHYASQTVSHNVNFVKDKAASYTTSIMPLLSLVGGGSYLKMASLGLYLAKQVQDNPFIQSFKEATQGGKYLAHFLKNQILFPNCSISLIGFSLGTQVILSCMEELYKYQQESIIQDIMMMGGVADAAKIQNMDKMPFLGGKLINCYSNNDGILKYFYKMLKFSAKAVGLNQINQNSKIFNYDLSSLIKAHLDYNKNLIEIFRKTDFNRDLNFNNHNQK